MTHDAESVAHRYEVTITFLVTVDAVDGRAAANAAEHLVHEGLVGPEDVLSYDVQQIIWK